MGYDLKFSNICGVRVIANQEVVNSIEAGSGLQIPVQIQEDLYPVRSGRLGLIFQCTGHLSFLKYKNT